MPLHYVHSLQWLPWPTVRAANTIEGFPWTVSWGEQDFLGIPASHSALMAESGLGRRVSSQYIQGYKCKHMELCHGAIRSCTIYLGGVFQNNETRYRVGGGKLFGCSHKVKNCLIIWKFHLPNANCLGMGAFKHFGERPGTKGNRTIAELRYQEKKRYQSLHTHFCSHKGLTRYIYSPYPPLRYCRSELWYEAQINGLGHVLSTWS